jgi:flagellar motility protein MotE (MotC chaperone)
MIPAALPIRLLPVTIFVLAALLMVKGVGLLRATIVPDHATTEMVAVAHAAPSDAQQPPLQSALSPPAEKPSDDNAIPPVTDGERAVLLELRQRRQELDAREAALAARESVFAAADQKLSGRVVELQALQKKLEALDAMRKERENASWQGLVKLYEAMKPREAATIFNDLDMPVLLQVVDRMKEAKAAPVLAAMQPDKARDLTAKLADMRTKDK